MRLRAAHADDARLLFSWINDSQIREAAFSSAPIQWEQHQAWFINKLKDPYCIIYIAEDDQAQALGQIRFDRDNLKATIDVHTNPMQREKGLGTEIIKQGCQQFNASHPNIRIQAIIKKTNLRSYKAFLKAGFVDSSICDDYTLIFNPH